MFISRSRRVLGAERCCWKRSDVSVFALALDMQNEVGGYSRDEESRPRVWHFKWKAEVRIARLSLFRRQLFPDSTNSNFHYYEDPGTEESTRGYCF